MIGSPLARPYLHFVYNVLEVTPFVLAFWDQTNLVNREYLARGPVGSEAISLPQAISLPLAGRGGEGV